MSISTPVIRKAPTDTHSALVIVVGKSLVASQAAIKLEAMGVSTAAVGSGRQALARVRDLAPDLVLVGHDDMTGREIVRQFRAVEDRGSGPAEPRVIVIGGPLRPADTGEGAASEEYHLPEDIGVEALVDQVGERLSRPGARTVAPSRGTLTEHRFQEDIDRELVQVKSSRRPGVLAAITVAELPQIQALGHPAEEAFAEAFDELFALDAHVLEQHSRGPDGGFLMMMPETDIDSARQRLQRFSRRVAATILDLAGEHVRVTPVIGYAAFHGDQSASELREQAAVALRDAELHLDLVPVAFSSALAARASEQPAKTDRLLNVIERLRAPLQVAFTSAALLSLPFIVYVVIWYLGFDLTAVTYPLVAAALAGTAGVLLVEGFRAVGGVELPDAPAYFPSATAIVAAYLPNEAATILDTVMSMLGQEYPGDLQVILAYNSPRQLPVEATLEDLAAKDPRLLLLRVQNSTSKAQNINAALRHVRGEFVGIFDADHHPAQGSFARAWRWLSSDYDIVQGHCVVRNGAASWVARLVAVEFETIYAVSHPGRARLHGFGIFGGSNGYWRRETLRQIRMQGSMLTEDIDSSMRSLRDGFKIVSDPQLVSSELAPTTLSALWHQRMRWAQGWTQTARRHLGPALSSERLNPRQKLGAAFLLGWAQVVPWITIQIIPILAFTAWREGGLGRLDWLVPLFVLLSIFTLSAGAVQAVLAYLIGDTRVTRHRGWFVLYAVHSTLWFGEFKNLIARVAQLKEVVGERQWRVTPRHAPAAATALPRTGSEPLERLTD